MLACPKCGSDNVVLDVLVMVSLRVVDGKPTALTDITLKEIEERALEEDLSDAKYYCYNCGNIAPYEIKKES